MVFEVLGELIERFDLVGHGLLAVHCGTAPKIALLEGYKVEFGDYTQVVLASFQRGKEIGVCCIGGLGYRTVPEYHLVHSQ